MKGGSSNNKLRKEDWDWDNSLIWPLLPAFKITLSPFPLWVCEGIGLNHRIAKSSSIGPWVQMQCTWQPILWNRYKWKCWSWNRHGCLKPFLWALLILYHVHLSPLELIMHLEKSLDKMICHISSGFFLGRLFPSVLFHPRPFTQSLLCLL